MANLIEQMNVLKGLDDQTLQAELNSPSGTAPPFMVLSEVQRRKDMRQRYEGEVARRQKRTTVAEDLGMPSMVGGMPAAGTGMGAPAPSGIAAATPEVPGFADGGLLDYADLADRYNTRLGELAGEKDRARALALLQAGAAIMGGGHSNTLQNIGIGAQAGIASYADALKTVDSEELNLMRGLTDIGQLQQAFASQEADRALRREELNYRVAQDKDPASIRETRAYMQMTPEEQAVHDRLHPEYNPNAVTNDMRLIDDANRAFEQALNALPPVNTLTEENFDKPPEQIAREQQRQAALLAYPKWVIIFGDAGKAAAMAKQYGVSDGDLLALAAPVSVAVNDKDPLGLGEF